MDNVSLFISQCTDLFRVGLVAGLIYTMERTRAQTGFVLPFVAGILFIAIIIPSTMPRPDISMLQAILTGLASNAAIFALLWAIWSLFKRRQQ